MTGIPNVPEIHNDLVKSLTDVRLTDVGPVGPQRTAEKHGHRASRPMTKHINPSRSTFVGDEPKSVHPEPFHHAEAPVESHGLT